MQLLIALLIRLPLVLFVALATTVLPGAASAQNLFSPAIVVNDSVVTYYELDQRTRMNQVLNAPGNPAEAAREQLIDDRIRLQAVQQAGIVLSEEDVLDGMSEFAGRANLTREEFVQALEGAGVAEQTFRDFVRAGLGWRELVQARFVGQVNITDTEIDRALSATGGGSEGLSPTQRFALTFLPQLFAVERPEPSHRWWNPLDWCRRWMGTEAS